MGLSAETCRTEGAAELGEVVHRIAVERFEAVIHRRPDRDPRAHDAYAVVIGPVPSAGHTPVVFNRDDLPIIEQLAQRAHVLICAAQCETVLMVPK